MRFLRLSLLALVVLAPALRVFAAEPVLKVTGPDKTLAFTAEEFAALPHIDLTLPAQGDQEERHFSGVTMREILQRAGAPLGDKLRGKNLLTGVVVHCKDNYAVLYALAEFDEAFSNRTILLADKDGGEELPPSAAPFRLVMPGDKKGARSAKQIVSIEIVSLAKP